MNKHLHIVCFDAPSPPNYGGAMDLFFKLKALANSGVEITLHYFAYKHERGHNGLKPYCKVIHVYPRKKPWQCLHSPLPYIVSSRINAQLIEKLNQDNDPVLLEGVHCTGIVPFFKKNRTVVVRLHNNEAAYYQRLSHTETNPFRNLYYAVESNRLERYQQQLSKGTFYAALSQTDMRIFKEKYGLQQTTFVPSFVPWQSLKGEAGLGTYCLYHGNLSVSENSSVTKWLVQHVFSGTEIPFVVAGRNAPPKLQQLIAANENVQLINNPSDEELEQLVQHAQVHVLPSLNETGVKLKLLHALFCGRHCLTNAAGVAGSGLDALVHLAEEAPDMQYTIKHLMQRPFTQTEMQQRQTLLHLYNNTRNAGELISWIWKHCQ